MKLTALVIALAIAAAPAAFAQSNGHGGHGAHGQGAQTPAGEMLASSTPADGAVLAEAPRTLALNFAHPVMLQTVSITGPDGAPVRASFRRPASPLAGYAIALAPLPDGAYRAQWTASGQGHQMQGVIGFTVR